MKTFVKILEKSLYVAIMVIYFPIFVVGWIIHKIARLLLATAYCIDFDFNKASDIIKNLMKRNL